MAVVCGGGSRLRGRRPPETGVGRFRRRRACTQRGRNWASNLAGSALVAVLAFTAGTFATDASLVIEVAAGKVNAPPSELFARAILYNWLVVLAVWSAIKMDNEVGKLVMVWWCLLAFIGSGYEHSVANMTLLTLANLVGGEAVSWVGMGYNLAVVTLGNIVSGVLMMGGAYWFVTESHDETSAAETGVTTTSPTGTDD